MMRSPPGGFLGGANLFRSLTLSPMNAALQQAHLMARRRLEAGGAAAPENRRDDQDANNEFLVPRDIDPLQIALAIADRLHGGGAPVAGLGNAGLMALAKKPNGAVIVLPEYVQRLGGGDASRGRRVLQQIVVGVHEQRRRSLEPPQASSGRA